MMDIIYVMKKIENIESIWVNKQGFISILAIIYLSLVVVIASYLYTEIKTYHHLTINQDLNELILIRYCKEILMQEELNENYIFYDGNKQYEVTCSNYQIQIYLDDQIMIVEYDEDHQIKYVYYR